MEGYGECKQDNHKGEKKLQNGLSHLEGDEDVVPNPWEDRDKISHELGAGVKDKDTGHLPASHDYHQKAKNWCDETHQKIKIV